LVKNGHCTHNRSMSEIARQLAQYNRAMQDNTPKPRLF